MPKRFVIHIVLPAVLAVLLFVLAIFQILIPSMERQLMERKKETIQELTRTAASILLEYHEEATTGRMTTAEAQAEAAARIRLLRYGEDGKDYFWITDMQPVMIMHPYRTDLNGQDLSDFEDLAGKKIFVEFVNAVRTAEAGYLDYYWQWKDDPQRIVPKLSYVQAFRPWQWVIGTGIYVEDVRLEIARTRQNLTYLSLAIMGMLALVLTYMAHQSLESERRRTRAEKDLIESNAKYRALVEAATEGTLMVLAGRCAHWNGTLLDLLGYPAEELAGLEAAHLLAVETDADRQAWGHLQSLLLGSPAPAEFEARLRRKDGEPVEVILFATPIVFNEQAGFILNARDLTRHKAELSAQQKSQAERENLIAQLQTSLFFLQEPITPAIKPAVTCEMHTPIGQAAARMTRQGSGAILVCGPNGEPVGILTDHDFRTRVVAEGFDPARPVCEVMTSPLVSISAQALVYEAILRMQEKGIGRLVVKDDAGRVKGLIRHRELVHYRQYSSVVLANTIREARSPDEIKEAHERLPSLVKALIDSGARVRHINRIITSVSDEITERLLALATAELGPPPVRYAFLTLGSQGRSEQTLLTDQDNGIIYEPPPPGQEQETAAYFLALGARVSAGLHQAGYPYCEGGIMASNERWNRPLPAWKEQFSHWIHNANPQELLELNMLFDFRCVSGDPALASELRQWVFDEMEAYPPFFLQFAQNALAYKPPLGILGNIQVVSSGDGPKALNLKDALLPVVNYARLYALKHRIEDTHTLDRLARLHERGLLSREAFEELAPDYEALMRMRLDRQAVALQEQRKPSNLISPQEWTALEEAMLKRAFAVIANLRKKISYDFLGMA